MAILPTDRITCFSNFALFTFRLSLSIHQYPTLWYSFVETLDYLYKNETCFIFYYYNNIFWESNTLFQLRVLYKKKHKAMILWIDKGAYYCRMYCQYDGIAFEKCIHKYIIYVNFWCVVILPLYQSWCIAWVVIENMLKPQRYLVSVLLVLWYLWVQW